MSRTFKALQRVLVDGPSMPDAVKNMEPKDMTKHPPFYPLFAHMEDTHGLTLLDSELVDIIEVVKKMIDDSPRIIPLCLECGVNPATIDGRCETCSMCVAGKKE